MFIYFILYVSHGCLILYSDLINLDYQFNDLFLQSEQYFTTNQNTVAIDNKSNNDHINL